MFANEPSGCTMVHFRRSHVIALGLLVLLASAFPPCSAEGEEEAAPDYSKMRVKELRKMLEERGVECKGCAEKADLVARVKETAHLPIVEEKSADPEKEASKARPEHREDIEELIRKLNKETGGGVKMFTKEDMEKMRNDPDAVRAPSPLPLSLSLVWQLTACARACGLFHSSTMPLGANSTLRVSSLTRPRGRRGQMSCRPKWPPAGQRTWRRARVYPAPKVVSSHG